VVTLRGERTAVVISAKAYDELTEKRPSVVDYLLSGPRWPDDLVETINRRAKTPSRGAAF
ncbi:MAG: type II toxin-antitoxin system prevent-host-death family antitoxin, partial [Methylocella sp.]